MWNGQHTERNLTLDPGDGAGWYPQFTRVLQAAAAHTWPSTDLFPSFGMASLPMTQAGWRWCNKCQGMFYSPGSPSLYPAGGAHNSSGAATTASHDSITLGWPSLIAGELWNAATYCCRLHQIWTCARSYNESITSAALL